MKILWVDDDWLTNSNSLQSVHKDLQNELEKHQSDFEIEVAYDSSVAYKMIDKNNYILAIIDVEFLDAKKNKQITIAQELFEKLESKRIHYAIYSNYIHDIKKVGNYCIGIYKKGNDRQLKFVDDIVKYISNTPYRIIQINDLHYTSTNDGSESDDFFQTLQQYINEIHLTKKIDLAFLAGDFASKNPSEELVVISDWIKKTFIDNLKLNNDRLFVVPGNHEVIWTDFQNKTRSFRPYSAYVKLLESIHKRDVLSCYVSWKRNEIPIETSESGLSCCRNTKFPCTSIIGICSNSSNQLEQGIGLISSDNIKYIRDKWKKNKASNETRILLLHHNLFPVRSNDSRDEERTIINSGKVLNILVESDCDIVLSGHTHRSETILYASTILTPSGYKSGKELLLISSGTCGGISPTFDIPKSFNIIDVTFDVNRSKRCVEVTPHLYDSRTATWENQKSAIFYI